VPPKKTVLAPTKVCAHYNVGTISGTLVAGHTAQMKKRLEMIFLGFGVALLPCALLGMLVVHHGGFQWLLVPSFLMVGIGGERKAWREKTESVPYTIWFAPNS